jgi:hypothetical protein
VGAGLLAKAVCLILGAGCAAVFASKLAPTKVALCS